MCWSEAFGGLDHPLGLGDSGLAAAHTASTGNLWALGALAAAVIGGNWVWHAWRHPYGPHWPCKGTGRNRGSNRKRHGDCKGCGGTGRRLRIGAQLFHKGIAQARRRNRETRRK